MTVPLRIAMLIAALPGWAAAAPAQPSISANVAIVSDYRFRGLSLSNRHAALQGSVDLATPGGWFVGTGGSTIANYGGAHLEVDLYGGRSGAAAGFDYAFTAYGYIYPGGHGVSYGEAQTALSRAVGPLTLGIDAAFSPHQRHTASRNVYAGISAAAPIPATPLTLTLRGGYEDGFYDAKKDWEARIGYERAHLAVSAAVLGTDRGTRRVLGSAAVTALVLSAAATF